MSRSPHAIHTFMIYNPCAFFSINLDWNALYIKFEGHYRNRVIINQPNQSRVLAFMFYLFLFTFRHGDKILAKSVLLEWNHIYKIYYFYRMISFFSFFVTIPTLDTHKKSSSSATRNKRGQRCKTSIYIFNLNFWIDENIEKSTL